MLMSFLYHYTKCDLKTPGESFHSKVCNPFPVLFLKMCAWYAYIMQHCAPNDVESYKEYGHLTARMSGFPPKQRVFIYLFKFLSEQSQ